MTITHIIESGGGSADFVLYLAKYLPNHHHHIIYGERAFTRITEVKQSNKNITLHPWKNVQREVSLIKDISSMFSLFKILKGVKSDVIHLHSSKAGFLGRVVCFFMGFNRVIYTPNGLPFIRKDISKTKRSFYLLLEKIASMMCGKVISCSGSESEEMNKNGISSTYINNGTEIFDLPNTINNNYDKATVTIATSGRATIQKNPKMFNEIALHFEKNSSYRFLWIGGGELENELNSKNVETTGWIDKSEVIKHLLNTDIYISTALWEGLPFAILEAMNLRKPLLLNRCVGNTDLVIPNYNGSIFNSSEEAIDLIKKMTESRTLLSEYGNNSRKLVEKEFNVIAMAQKYENKYMSLSNSK